MDGSSSLCFKDYRYHGCQPCMPGRGGCSMRALTLKQPCGLLFGCLPAVAGKSLRSSSRQLAALPPWRGSKHTSPELKLTSPVFPAHTLQADALAQELEVAWARVRQPAEQEGEETKLQQPADDGGRHVIINATAKAAQTAAEAAGAAAKAAMEAQRAAEAAAAQAAAHAHAAATQAVAAQAAAAHAAAEHASAHARAAAQAAARAAHAAGTLQAAAQAAGKAAEAAAQASAAAAAGAAGAQAAADQALGVQAAAPRNAAASEGIGVRRELSSARDSISEAASGQPQPDAGGVEDSSPSGEGQHSEL